MTKPIATLPEQDGATAIDNMRKSFGEDRMNSSAGMLADRQSHTLIAILPSPLLAAEQKIHA